MIDASPAVEGGAPNRMSRTHVTLSMAVLAAALTAAPACAQSPAATRTAVPSDVAAKIGDRTLTVEEIDRKWRELDAASYMKSTQEMFDIRRRVIDVLVGDHLLAEEAKKRGLTTEELVAQEVPKRIQEITETDLQAAYNQMRSQMGGRTLDEVRAPLAQYLAQQRQTEARQALVDELRAKASGLEVYLDPPRFSIEASADEPVRGPANAPVEIIEFSDFQCPYCARVVPTLARLQETFGDQIKLVFRDFPLTSIHPQAYQAAEAAECAFAQGKFWEFHDRVFANPRALALDDLKGHAAALGLDLAAFTSCVEEGQARPHVDADLEAGQALGISATPAVFINGRFVSGAQPYEVFEAIIQDELSRRR